MPTLNWLTRDEDVREASRAPCRLLEEASDLQRDFLQVRCCRRVGVVRFIADVKSGVMIPPAVPNRLRLQSYRLRLFRRPLNERAESHHRHVAGAYAALG